MCTLAVFVGFPSFRFTTAQYTDYSRAFCTRFVFFLQQSSAF